MKSIALLLILISVHRSCDHGIDLGLQEKYPPVDPGPVTISQGIWGNVWFWEGNFQPVHRGTITPAVRTVYVYGLTGLDQVEQVFYSPFFRAIHSRLIDSTRSDPTGFFEFGLPPGEYSLFVREDSLYYANLYDGSGNIHPATVSQDSLTQVRIDITYKATF